MRLNARRGSEQYHANELVDGVLVNTPRGWRAEPVEHRQFAMIQIWKPKHPATVIRLDSVLPCACSSAYLFPFLRPKSYSASFGKRGSSQELFHCMAVS